MASEQDKAILNSIFNPLLPLGEYVEEELPIELQDSEDEIPNIANIKKLEVEGVRAAEHGDIGAALDIFTQVINLAPNWASGYNNRAQACRLKGDIAGAMRDLNKAVNISGGKGRSGCQALCQRGIIHRKEGSDELARNDFQAAAQLGSQFAKMQLVDMNPYAALCNQMLHNIMEKLQNADHD
ncbi:Tetratricopeptide repeat protein 36 [Blattella germanica]|nr:Tetratricopeptide repeat protein 36 [Blattella germanica]